MQGMILLTLSAIATASIHPVVISLQHALSFLGLFLTALGLGGIWPCVPTFGADQFDDTDGAEKVQKEIYYNWYYFAVNGGYFFASTVLVWVQDNCGWGLGFGIPTLFSVIGIVGFLASIKLYRYQKPGGSVFTRIFQVVVATTRKINVDVPNDSSLLYEIPGTESAIVGSRKLIHTDGLRLVKTIFCPSSTFLHSKFQNHIHILYGSNTFEWLWCLASLIELPPSLPLMKNFLTHQIHGSFAPLPKWKS